MKMLISKLLTLSVFLPLVAWPVPAFAQESGNDPSSGSAAACDDLSIPESSPRRDPAVVLFDYQTVNEPLSRIEATLDHIAPVVVTDGFLDATLFDIGDLWLTERGIWEQTAFPTLARLPVEFHPAAECGRAALRLLRLASGTFASARVEEGLIARFGDRDGRGMDALSRSRQSISEYVSEAALYFQTARELLESARSGLLG